MAKTNLFWIDDVLLKSAIWLGVAAGFVLLALVGLGEDARDLIPFSAKAALAGLIIAPFALGMTGLRLRRRDQRAASLARLIDDEVEVSAPELIRNSDWTRETLDRAIRDLNNAAVAHLVWDRETGWIQDGRLRRSMAAIDDCEACGAKVSVEMAVGKLRGFECPYCSAAIGDGRLAEEKARVIDSLESDRSPEVGPQRLFSSDTFSPMTFFLLLVFCWPVAILYAMKSRGGRESHFLSF